MAFLVLVFACLSSNLDQFGVRIGLPHIFHIINPALISELHNLDQVRSGVGLLHANPNWKERDS